MSANKLTGKLTVFLHKPYTASYLFFLEINTCPIKTKLPKVSTAYMEMNGMNIECSFANKQPSSG